MVGRPAGNSGSWRFGLLVLFTATAAYPAIAAAASFNCSRASTFVEKQICTDPTLSAHDNEMAALYKRLRASSKSGELVSSQRKWLRQMVLCTDPACISRLQTERLAELRQFSTIDAPAGAPISAPSPVTVSDQLSSGFASGSAQPAPANAPAPGDPSLKSVDAVGIGSTSDAAAVNAAENALTQVVGSFVDTQKQLDKKTEIQDGIRSESKTITSQTREYSQGSIEKFEIRGTRQDGAVIRIEARVVVRLRDFHAYMARVLEGGVALRKGLFASVEASQQQREDQSALLFDRILKPLKRNDGFTLTVSDPQGLSEWSRSRDPRSLRSDVNWELQQWLSRNQSLDGEYQVFHVAMADDGSATEQIANVARHIADDGCRESQSRRQAIPNPAFGELPVSGAHIEVWFQEGRSSVQDVCVITTQDRSRLENEIRMLRQPRVTFSFLMNTMSSRKNTV